MKTIAAIATGLTPSGIGIVRISGPESYEVIRRIFRPGKKATESAASAATPTDLSEDDLFSKPNRIHYGMIVSRETFVDEVLVMNMKAPHSYTGEDTIEIDCHGGPLMMRRILQAVLECGADVRLAEPGEFTKRAFLNGRIDLSQAESVIDIINATNENSQKAAVSQLRGSVSNAVRSLRDRLLRQSAFIEAALDDPEHYVLDEESKEVLREELQSVLEKTEELIRTYHYGKIVKEGINTCILGKPNAGKSSLLNALLGEERAIVTEIPGTTRDVITESLVVGNLTLNIMDTAGIRDTGDLVESIGVKKAYEMAKGADLCLYIVDASTKMDEKDREILEFIRENRLKTVMVINKTDLCIRDEVSIADIPTEVIRISAKTGAGIDELIRKICSMFDDGMLRMNDQVVITSERHMTHLKDAKRAIMRVLASVEDGLPEDFYTIDLMDAYHSLGLIIGEETEDDLCDRIFSEFCMGK